MERKKPRKERRHKKSEEFEPFEGERRQRYEQVLKSLLDDYASLQKFLATFSGSCLVFSVTFLDKDHIPGAIKIAWVLWGLTIICVLLSLGLSILFQDRYLKTLSNGNITWDKIPNQGNFWQGLFTVLSLLCFIFAFVSFSYPFF